MSLSDPVGNPFMPRKITMPKGKLGPNFVRKVLPWVEIYWHQHKRYPSDTELSAQFGFEPDDLTRLKLSKYYNLCLKERGISQNESFFNEMQVAAISLITNFHDTRPVAAKLAGIGVTTEMYNGWMQNPAFKQELTNRASEILDNIQPEAQVQLATQIKKGSFQALKFYFEMTGQANSPEAINLKLTVARLIEAVQKHVKDPAVLQAIAAEIQGVAPVAEVPTTPIPALSAKGLYKEHLNGIHNQ